MRRAIEEAATALGADFRNHTLAVLLTDDAAVRRLNAQWRGIDKPTNVLSFPPADMPGDAAVKSLGDIAIAHETTAREAETEDKPFAHHLSHLAVHGFLHLMGYDHEKDGEAETMEQLERVILARARRARSLRGLARNGRGLTPMPDTDAPSRNDSNSASRRSAGAHQSAGAGAAAGAGRTRTGRDLALARAARRVRLEVVGARRSADRAGRRRARRGRLLAARAHHAHQHPGAARAPGRRRDGAARRHHLGAAGHFARRSDQGVRGRRPLAPRRLQRDARRSGRHGAHPRRDRPHGETRHRQRGEKHAAQEAAHRQPRPEGGRSVDDAVGREDHPSDPVRAALDAGDRPARQDAGDAHPSGAGDRRVRRHRRHRVDRGRGRADRRRHRGRARRGRSALDRQAGGRLVPRRCARAAGRSRRGGRLRVRRRRKKPPRSIRSPATS